MYKALYGRFEKAGLLKQERLFSYLQVILGAFYLAALSQWTIPLTPVPITLQTFAIFTLGLFLGPKKAFASVLTYLCAGTLGAPVFPHFLSNPFWILSAKAGYYVSFPIAAYLIGWISSSKTSYRFFWYALSVLAGQCVIYTLGVSWLSCFVGIEKAIAVGFLPFIPMAAIKLFAAVALRMSVSSLSSAK